MLSVLTRRFPWLSPSHPLAAREAHRDHQTLPTLLRKLTDPWTMLGYAALLHGMFFIISLFSYNRINRAFPNMMLPFLTPFGTPVAVAVLHSILYWAMLIGICNQMTYFISSDLQAGTWGVLRTAPYSTSEILLVKMAVVGRIWLRVVRMLLLTRGLALLLIPISAMVQRGSETYSEVGLDAVGGAVFLLQPLADAFMIASLSLLSAFLVQGLMWAKIGAYALATVVYGALSGTGGLWLIYKSPLGTLGGLLVPLNHWAALVSAVTPSSSPEELSMRTLVLLLVYILLPIGIGVVAFRAATRLAESHY
jgi:hypothetical protein